MSLKEDIAGFVDGNGLVTPQPFVQGSASTGSANGPLYTSIFCILLKQNEELTPLDIETYTSLILECIDSDGLLYRNPVFLKGEQEGPDDYYGVLAACAVLGVTTIPRDFLKAVIKYFGSLNNVNPGHWTPEAFLIRQPQLLASMISAAFPSRINPLHYLIRLLFFPLYLIAAIVIATSCIKTPIYDVDARVLSWALIQSTSRVSILCHLASLIWATRLAKDYGTAGMRGVADQYYLPKGQHPFCKYWIS